MFLITEELKTPETLKREISCEPMSRSFSVPPKLQP